MKKLYIGNLSYSTTQESLREFFNDYSPVSVKIIVDNYTNQSRGFGFVEIEDAEIANRAIAELNGKALDGKTLTINEARPQTGGGSGGGRSFGNSRPRSSNDRSRPSHGGRGGGYR